MKYATQPMKTAPLLLLPLFLLRGAGAADPNAIAVLARQAPAEFAADAMIRLASSEKVDAGLRVALLAEAFKRAADAQRPLKLHASITRPGTTGTLLEHAYRQDLDALSLRLRAVEAMMPLDSARARQMFLSIPPPAVPAVRCDEIVVYDVRRYYEDLGAIAKLKPKAAAKVLRGRVANLTSPAQIAPAAQLLQQVNLKNSDLRNFTLSLAVNLRAILGDDRSFVYYAAATGPAILGLTEEIKSRHLDPLPLAGAYRLYLVHHLSGDRCADDQLMDNIGATFNVITGQPVDRLGADAADFFAAKILTPPLQPLSEQETTPKSLDGFAAGVRACQDSQCQDLNARLRDLALDPDGHETDAWRARLQAVLATLQGWQPGRGQADEVYRNKSWVFSNLFSMSTGGSQEMVLRAWLDCIKQSRSSVSDRAQWLLPLSSLIGRVALEQAHPELAEELRRENDPVIALYAQLEPLAPRPASVILSLM